jgi:GNAT superfamily N-acetyltransferase
VPDLRDLQIRDAKALAGFVCDRWWAPHDWADEAETFIRRGLAGALERAEASAVGLWDDDKLIGVGAWVVESETRWRVVTIAVDIDNRGRRYGRALKSEILARARGNDVTEVISFVDRRNESMIRINETLGGVARPDPGNRTYVIFAFRP